MKLELNITQALLLKKHDNKAFLYSASPCLRILGKELIFSSLWDMIYWEWAFLVTRDWPWHGTLKMSTWQQRINDAFNNWSVLLSDNRNAFKERHWPKKGKYKQYYKWSFFKIEKLPYQRNRLTQNVKRGKGFITAGVVSIMGMI